MRRSQVRELVALVALLLVVVVSAALARLVETDFGKLDVRVVRIASDGATLTGKLYRPAVLPTDHRVPAVLALHGYQNDKETQGAFALELARRGVVVLALDLVGHGGSSRPEAFANRRDPTRGGQAGYQYVKTLPDVRADRIGIIGHSLGAMSAVAVAARNPDHRAVNSQCGPAGTMALHNLLLTQARFEEFRIFREGAARVDALVTHPRRLRAFGRVDRVAWGTTYGRFDDGSARRAALVETVHPGVTHHPAAVAETVAWMQAALEPVALGVAPLAPDDQRFMWKEWATLAALLATLLSALPLASLLIRTPWFSRVARPLPAGPVAARGTWWRLLAVNTVVAACTYPPLTRLGGLSDQIGMLVPPLRLPIGNGVAAWFLANAVIEAGLLWWWLRTTGRRSGATLQGIGLAASPRVCGATALVAGILMAWMYGLVAVSERSAGIEFRFWWPMMREFSVERFGLFWLYLPPALAFFLLNGGALLFGQARLPERGTAARTQVSWWVHNCGIGLLGLAVVWAIQYVPFRLLGTSPGFEALGLPQFGELWPLMLFGYIPIFAVLTFVLTWCYRRTGRVLLGALIVAAVATWFTAAGSVLGR